MTDVWTSGDVTLYLGDCLDIMPQIADGSVDAVVTDPPYGIGIADWDIPPTDRHWSEIIRVAREFVAFFCQAPTMFEWAQKMSEMGARYCEHVVWVKRISTPGIRLGRGHESILIYSVGKKRTFYQTSGPYEDVRLPGLAYGITTETSLDRYIKDLRAKANGTARPMRRETMRSETFAHLGHVQKHERSPELVNYTNVWSFLGPNTSRRNGEHPHPTEKPIGVVQRLVEMVADVDSVILDPYMGCGTTGVGCVQTGRRFIGIEINPDYFEVAKQRIVEAQMQPQLEGM